MGTGGISNVTPFRKAGTAPRVDCADNGAGRSCNRLDRPVSNSVPDLPCDAEAQSFEAPERFAESFVCTDALDSAHGVYAWVIGFFIFDAVAIATGIWVLG